MFLILREVVCSWVPCGQNFALCSACDHGQRYCSDDCRDKARRCNQRRARRKYARSEKGRKNNCERQRRFRAGMAEKMRSDAKKSNGSLFSAGPKCVELDSWSGPGGDAVGCASAPVNARREEALSAFDIASTVSDAEAEYGAESGTDSTTNAQAGGREGCGADGGTDSTANAQAGGREECGPVSAMSTVSVAEEVIGYCHVCSRPGRVVNRSASRGRFRRTGHQRSQPV